MFWSFDCSTCFTVFIEFSPFSHSLWQVCGYREHGVCYNVVSDSLVLLMARVHQCTFSFSSCIACMLCHEHEGGLEGGLLTLAG